MVKRTSKKLPAAISPVVWGYLALLEKKGVPVTAAYVFGSWAKGKQHRWSDIDLAVISPSFGGWEQKNKMLVQALYDDLLAVEPHGFSPKDFDNLNNPVVNEIRNFSIKVI